MTREREAQELAAAADRMMRALARRASTGDETAVLALQELEAVASGHLFIGVNAWREWVPAKGPSHSWTDVGTLLGISRQAAQQRFGPRE